MKIIAYESQGHIGTHIHDSYTGKYKIHIACIYGNFFQRHSWETTSGEYSPDSWIKSYFTNKESFDRVTAKMSKVELDVVEQDFS